MNERILDVENSGIESNNGLPTTMSTNVDKVLSLPGMNFSDSDLAFLEELRTKGLLHKLSEITAYHVSPTINREDIMNNGFHNSNSLFTQEQISFLRFFLQRLPANKAPNFDINSLILGERNGVRRGIYLSFSQPYSFAYPVPENVRFYFTVLSENFDLLSTKERAQVIDDFRSFHKKFSLGTDIWQVKMIKNPELFSLFLPEIKSLYDNFPEIFDGKDVLGFGNNFELPYPISCGGIELVGTEIKNPIDMWTLRCKNLIDIL